MPGYSFDAGTLFGSTSVEPLPPAPPGEILLRVPAAISPRLLRESDVGRQLIWQHQVWYDEYQWANEPVLPGLYHLRLPIPGSNNKTFDEQKALLLEAEEPTSLVLVELALLCFEKAGLPDPLQESWVCCSETAYEGRVMLCWYNGRLNLVDHWYVNRYSTIWHSAARRVS